MGYRMRNAISALLIAALLFAPTAFANSPCSGKKGGVDHCEGSTFVCHDGSVSASKKACSSGGGALGLLGSQSEEMAPTAAGDAHAGLASIVRAREADTFAPPTAAARATCESDDDS